MASTTPSPPVIEGMVVATLLHADVAPDHRLGGTLSGIVPQNG
jgi:hypothetical protein